MAEVERSIRHMGIISPKNILIETKTNLLVYFYSVWRTLSEFE